MATFLDDVISNIAASRIDVMNALSGLESWVHSAGSYIGSQNWADAEICLHNASDEFWEMKMALTNLTASIVVQTRKGFILIQSNWPDAAAEVTMSSLLTAMLSADPYQIMYFVGLVDAYRQSIWNRPFNKEFYAALARGFMQWE